MTVRIKQILLYYVPVAVWLLLIYIFSSIGNLPQINNYNLPVDKVAHFVEFGILAYLFIRALYYGTGLFDLKQSILITSGVALFFAASDEFHQLYVPGRLASYTDLIADCAGIGISLLVFAMFLKARNNNR